MNILMVNKFLYPNGGSETYIFKIGEYLKKIGHQVEFFGMEHEGRCVSNKVEAYTSDMDFHNASKLDKLTYPLKTIYSLEARRKIRLVLDNLKPEVVHLNNFNFQLTPSIILEIVKFKKETGINTKIIFTAHDYQLVCPNHMMRNPQNGDNCEKCVGGKFYNCIKGKCIHGSTAKSAVGALEAYHWNMRKTYQYIDAIICPSRFMKTKLDTNPMFITKTIALHNFIDDVKWTELSKENYILYFGRFSKEKGIQTLIDTCRSLPNIQFVFAGNGPLENEVNKVPNIRNVGFQSGDRLEQLIRKAKFSIYPSEWYENCPFSVMESQMFGTPVIGADIGGIPELIELNRTGLLFESGNKDDLSEKITSLWENETMLKKYSENCKDIKFDTIAEYCDKLMNIYYG